MNEEEKFLKAIEKLRETDVKRNFDQTIDLIINLKNFDVRKEAFNLFVEMPHKIKEKKVFGFLEKKSELVESIKKNEFIRYKEKKDIKRLIKDYDFFIANAKLMPSVASTFGRILGPAGKMPSPQLGIISTEDELSIQSALDKIESTVRVKVKEPSIKVAVAKESLTNEQILDNVLAVYQRILDNLPKKKENVKNILIKFSMDKPIKVEV